MKQLSFRPFRRVGKRLVVTNYMGWRKLYTANYGEATVRLLPFPKIIKGELVYAMVDNKGDYKHLYQQKFEPLFWPVNGKIVYKNIEESVAFISEGLPNDMGLKLRENEVYSMFDCDGCPAFSHKSAAYVALNYPEKMHLFEPLTADIVYEYFEKMRDKLINIKWVHNPQSYK